MTFLIWHRNIGMAWRAVGRRRNREGLDERDYEWIDHDFRDALDQALELPYHDRSGYWIVTCPETGETRRYSVDFPTPAPPPEPTIKEMT